MDVAKYKRMLQGFFDPEPKNDRVPESKIWCLGTQYKNSHPSSSATASTNASTAARAKGANGDRADGPEQVSKPLTTEDADLNWPTEFLDDHESRFWITYRSDFPPIARSVSASMTLSVRLRSLTEKDGFTSDTGWGYWRRSQLSDEEKRLLSYFADNPDAPFSIHKFVEHGADACGKHPGEWFGPSATARCIQALAGTYEQAGLQVYMNADGADVYQDEVLRTAAAPDGSFVPTLILLGVRLGIDRVTPAYWEALKFSLQLTQSVGIAGGRPASSHYFIAYQGDDFFYLDPHFTRPALPFHSTPAQYSDEEVDSCHTRRLRRINIGDLDPSMLLAFLIKDEDDWRAWRAELDGFDGKSIVHIADTSPSHGHTHERSSAFDDVETFDDEDEIQH